MAVVDKRTVELTAENEFELPVGYVDSTGVLHKTFKLREMTGEVEESIADKKVRNNPGKIVTELIYGVLESLGTLPKIDRGVIKKLSNVDRDFILLMNYLYSLDDVIEWMDVCVYCNGRMDIKVNVEDIPVKYFTHDEPRTVSLVLPRGIEGADGVRYKEIEMSFPNGFVQETVFSKVENNPAEAMSITFANCTESIKGLSDWNFETFKRMSKKDRNFIQREMAKIEVGAEMSTKLECPHCGSENHSPVPLQKLLGE